MFLTVGRESGFPEFKTLLKFTNFTYIQKCPLDFILKFSTLILTFIDTVYCFYCKHYIVISHVCPIVSCSDTARAGLGRSDVDCPIIIIRFVPVCYDFR